MQGSSRPSAGMAFKSIEQPPYTPAASTMLPQPTAEQREQTGFSFEGQYHSARNAIDTLRQVFDLFIKRDPELWDSFCRLAQAWQDPTVSGPRSK